MRAECCVLLRIVGTQKGDLGAHEGELGERVKPAMA